MFLKIKNMIKIKRSR